MEQIASNGEVLYFYQDQPGSTRALLNQSGTTVATFAYFAYGTLKSSTGTTTTPFGFAGQYTDSEWGLLYLRNRYYDPGTDQFLTVDPLSSQTQQPYGYAGDNPVNWDDPSGLCRAGFVNLPVGGRGRCSDEVDQGIREGAHIALDLAAVPPYTAYYVSYEVSRRVNRWGAQHGPAAVIASRTATAPLIVPEGLGLGEDVVIDWIKGHSVNNETPCDEGKVGYINPLHAYVPRPLRGPVTYLPGVHRGGAVDWEW
ncbi:MAG TPA: RHS repeat-associated core domain-containing protein [Chloroflexota bacterium]|nr:RHS repeat-associated core domain-containing protein [Chloroflexota bacterium]